MERFEGEAALAGAKQIPVEAAPVFLAGAVGAGDGARATVELVLPRHDAPGHVGLASLIEDARAIKAAAADEIVDQAEVVFDIEGDAAVFPAGVDRGQGEVECIDCRARPERSGQRDRSAVGESHDRVFGVLTGVVDGLGAGGESAAAEPPGGSIVELHVGIAEAEWAGRFPPHVAGPRHRSALAKHARGGSLDAVPDAGSVRQQAVGQSAVGFDAGRVARAEEGVGHAPIDALHPPVGDDPFTGSGHEGGARGDREIIGELPAHDTQRHDRVVLAVVGRAEQGQRPDQLLMCHVAVRREHEAIDVEGVDVADRRVLAGGVLPAGAAAGELEPPHLHEALDVGREGEAARLSGVVEPQALGRSCVGGRRVGSSAGGRELASDLRLDEFLELGRVEAVLGRRRLFLHGLRWHWEADTLERGWEFGGWSGQDCGWRLSSSRRGSRACQPRDTHGHDQRGCPLSACGVRASGHWLLVEKGTRTRGPPRRSLCVIGPDCDGPAGFLDQAVWVDCRAYGCLVSW